MRTTIANRFDESLTAIQTHARQVADEQNRLSTGTKLLRASDSPIAIGRAVDLRTSSAHLDSLKRLQGAATNRMAEAELAMQDAARVLDDFHQLWAATQNGSLGPDQLRLFSTQARALQEELRQTLTRTDAGGYRLFDSKSLLVMIGGGSNNVDPISVDTVGAISDLKVLNSTLDPDWLTSASSLDAAIDKITIDADSLIAKFVQSLQAGERPVVLNQEFKTASQPWFYSVLLLAQTRLGLSAPLNAPTMFNWQRKRRCRLRWTPTMPPQAWKYKKLRLYLRQRRRSRPRSVP